MTATELARNTSKVLDRVATRGEVIAIERNQVVIAHIVPPRRKMTAAEAFAGLAGRLTPEQGVSWLKDSKGDDYFDNSVRDPWI